MLGWPKGRGAGLGCRRERQRWEQGKGALSYLSQLLTRGLVFRTLAQVFHALVLGQEVLLLAIHLVIVPLVEQFAVGQRVGHRAGLSALQQHVACLPGGRPTLIPGVASPWRTQIPPGRIF